MSNIAEDVTDYEFRQLFRGYNASKVRLITDYTTKKCKGFGFITFMDKFVFMLKIHSFVGKMPIELLLN